MAISQDQFRVIISGQRMDAMARILRSLLRLMSLGYGMVVRIRNILYDHRILTSHRVDAFVLSVGNLTTGGTGKTPLVAWLAKHLQRKVSRVAVLTRGYKADRQLSTINRQPPQIGTVPIWKGDEPAELARACPGVPIIVNPDRVAGAMEAIHNHRTQVLVLDDGFQHRRLAHDLDIVTIDATEPFGYGRLLPAGLLREPLTSLHRAHAIVLTRCDQVAPPTLDEIEATVHRIHPSLPIARSIHAPAAVELADGSKLNPSQLKDKKVFAFCGLGNPEGFLRTVESCGCKIVGKRVFDDHQAYSDRILADLHGQAQSSGAELLLTTQKDWTKIKCLPLPNFPPALACLVVELAFISGSESLTVLIDRALAGRISASCTNYY
jgi:tetraacyldisaccharide 4'-kinase